MSQSHVSSNAHGKGPLNLPANQAAGVSKELKHETVRVPSSSTPVWGSFFNVLLRQKNFELHNTTLELSLNALSGVTDSSGASCGISPTWFWFTRIDVLINGVTLQSLYPLSQFLRTQYFSTCDEKRTLACYQSGCDANISTSSLISKSSTASVWYLPMRTLFDNCSLPLLFQSQDVELRFYMDTLSNQIVTTNNRTFTGTPSATINSAQLLLNVTQLPPSRVQDITTTLTRAPLSYAFNEERVMTVALQSGSTGYSIPLTGFVGTVSILLFTIRTTSPTGAYQWNYNTNLYSFEVLNGNSISIVGGQPYLDLQARYQAASRWINTTYPIVSGAGAYFYSWSTSPEDSENDSSHFGSYMFTANETLNLKFNVAPTSNIQVDLFALTHSAVQVGSGGSVKKLDL